jgi:hypothetical protein
MGSPVGCTGYTDEGMCRQTFSFQGKQAEGAQWKSCSVERGSDSLPYWVSCTVYVGAGSELCDIRDGFKVRFSLHT